MKRIIPAVVLALTAVIACTLPGERPACAARDRIGRVSGIKWPVFNPETGRKEWQLEAESAKQMPGGNYDIFKPKIELLANRGDKDAPDRDDLFIVADKGLFDRKANVVNLNDNVVITIKDRQNTHVETDHATWDATKRMATSTGAVVVTNSGMVLTGEGFAFGPALGSEDRQPSVVVIMRNVRALLKGSATTANLFSPMQSDTVDTKKPADEPVAPEDEEVPPPGEDIIITCDGSLRGDRTEGIIRFNRNVRVEKGSTALTCERLTIHIDPTTNKISLLLAAGSVVMGDPSRDNGGSGDRFIWTADDGAGKLSGVPAVTWMDQIRIESPSITFSTEGQRIVWHKRASMRLYVSGLFPGSGR